MKIPNRNANLAISVHLWVWCALGLVFWQILLWAQPPSILMDDGGEMIAASFNLGLPHPPGYPLFDLLGHLFSWLAVGTAAFRFGLMSSLIVLLSLMVILKTCLETTKKINRDKNISVPLSTIILMMTALVFLSCRTIFSQCLTAKGSVYALTLLLVSVLVWFRVGDPKGNRVAYAVWFFWGLGLANHWQTVILLAPFLIFLTVLESGLTIKNTVFIGFFSMLGLSLYLYLPLRSVLAAQPSWGFPFRWPEFKWVVLRQLVADEEMKMHPLGFYGEALVKIIQSYQDWMPGAAVAAMAGLYAFYRIDKKLFRDFLILVVPFVLALTAMHEPNNLYLIPVYGMPFSGLAVLLGFVGFFWFLSKGGRIFQRWVVALLFLFSIFWGWSVFDEQNRSRYTLAEDFGLNVMKCLPKNAVLLMDGDNYVMPLWYEKYVNHQRPDLIVEPTVFLYHDWGWNQMVIQSDDLKTISETSLSFNEKFVRLAENSRHPFFYSFGRQFFPKNLNRLHKGWSPRGLVDSWTPTSFIAENLYPRDRLRNLEKNREAAWEDPPTNDLYLCYSEQCLTAANWYQDHGEGLSALALLESDLFFQPQSARVYGNMASLIGSMGYLEMSRALAQMAIQADPQMGSSYADLAKVDGAQGHYLEARQEYEMAAKWGANPQLVEAQIGLLNRLAERQVKTQDKNAREYEKWSGILKKRGCPFLGELASLGPQEGKKSLN